MGYITLPVYKLYSITLNLEIPEKTIFLDNKIVILKILW